MVSQKGVINELDETHTQQNNYNKKIVFSILVVSVVAALAAIIYIIVDKTSSYIFFHDESFHGFQLLM